MLFRSLWLQKYGPSTVSFSDSSNISPTVTGLEEGVYLFELTVFDGNLKARDNCMIIVSKTAKLAPTVSITFPIDQSISQ